MDERDTPLPVQAKQILKYYLANQRTVDTLEGIASWLVLEQLVERRVDDAEAGLEWLVSHGFLDRVTSAATPPLYRLNAEKVDEAVRLLKASQ